MNEEGSAELGPEVSATWRLEVDVKERRIGILDEEGAGVTGVRRCFVVDECSLVATEPRLDV